MATFFAACLFAAATVLALFAIISTVKSHGALALQAIRQSGAVPATPSYMVRFRNGLAAPQAMAVRPRNSATATRRAAISRTVQTRSSANCVAA